MSLKTIKDARVFYRKALKFEPWNRDARERLDELMERQRLENRWLRSGIKSH